MQWDLNRIVSMSAAGEESDEDDEDDDEDYDRSIPLPDARRDEIEGWIEKASSLPSSFSPPPPSSEIDSDDESDNFNRTFATRRSR